MAIKRNDPCTCGSGKKYKKCCMLQENIITLHEVKEERFYQQKHVLVIKVKDFIEKAIPTSQLYQLHSEFKNRSRHSIKDKGAEKAIYDYWLIFFHTFENGLRGIEWFLRENESRLSQAEKEMANTWVSLKPKLVQAVNNSEDSILFEDIITKDQYPVSTFKENIPNFAPWFGTLGLLEQFEQFYYFNGVRIFKDPESMKRAANKLEEIVSEKKISHEQALVDFFPEMLAALTTNKERPQNPTEITQYNLKYNVLDDSAVASFVNSEEAIVIDSWNFGKKLASWVTDWHEYKDSGLKKPVLVGNVLGSISQNNHELIFNTFEKNLVDEFKHMLENALDSTAISFVTVDTHTQTIPYQVELKNTIASFQEGTAPYFALYAQNDIRQELDIKIPLLGERSILELIEAGETERVETYLQSLEYNMYVQVEKDNGSVPVTADFNAVRKELGLPLSPFVTGGENRRTFYTPIILSDKKQKPLVNEEDIPVYELLGFTPTSVDNFYSEDLVTFFKEKTDSKAEATLRKYRNCLFDLRELLEGHEKTSWNECDKDFWQQVLTVDFPSLYDPISKTVIKDFTSTTKALAKWLDKGKKSTSLGKTVADVVKEEEEKMLSLV
ncbi:SEC-C domain-containing protein [Metabacillus litoralis]|uniref:SEC-C domain-containing protein n=1 Tax=Metabacillus litoralis TaxID=152268 RepID=UPI001CFC9838|nr:SEC-C domain-containing protein [Metabacillus litoralis]